MLRLTNPVQRYAWGSTTAIPELLGAVPDGEPVAEVWMGAHPLAPSSVQPAGGGPPVPLDAAIAASPVDLLGAEVVQRWGARLPFLLKLLAAAAPLSLQAHPTAERAASGYAREEAAGLHRDAPTRRYRDAWHKPEVLLALTPFRALCGVRPPAQTLAVLDGLELDAGSAARSPTLAAFAAALGRDDPTDAVRAAFDVATGAGPAELAGACEALALASGARLERGGGRGDHAADDVCVVELQRSHPADVGVLLSVLLHHVSLAPGGCLYMAPGQVHAYLSGLAVEAMATSDNVLRAGLTRKHVDVAELASVVDLTPCRAPLLAPERRGPGLTTFQPPVDDVGLDVVDVGPGPGGGTRGSLPPEGGPRIVLALAGEVLLEGGGASLPLCPGESVFVPAGEAVGARGAGRLAVARVGRRAATDPTAPTGAPLP